MRVTGKIGTAIAMAWLVSGCVGFPDKEGWHYGQKKEFLEILKEDRYLSVCDAKPLYDRIKSTPSSKAMSEMLIRYTENLANGCIDLDAFNKAQKARQSDDYKTQYEVYLQRVNRTHILAQLREGKSVASILAPYVPKYREFSRLVDAYKKRSKEEGADEALLRKIRLNVERVKLMKPLKGNAYALINIPEYKVRIIENGETKVAMRVVVGKPNMQTPIFSQMLQYIVLNPPWNVPDSIVRKEILPKVIKDPSYLKRHRMVVRKTYNLDSPEVKLSDYDLSKYVGGKGYVPFKFIEVPSKKNGLGRVKFLFPNRYSVYMHDTQSKYLFKRSYRAYSHGCIRLAEPNAMLRYLVEHYSDTPWEEAKKMYDSLKTHYIKITKPLPVHTAYLTVYVEDDGRLLSFKDIYGYDRIQRLRR